MIKEIIFFATTIIGVMWYVFRQGKESVKNEQRKKALQNVRKNTELQEDIENLSDNDINEHRTKLFDEYADK